MRFAHRLRATMGPPADWTPGDPMTTFVPPAPQPEVMRAGALGAHGRDASLGRA